MTLIKNEKKLKIAYFFIAINIIFMNLPFNSQNSNLSDQYSKLPDQDPISFQTIEIPIASDLEQINYKWNITWGGLGDEEGHAIAVDSLGSIYVSGYYKESTDWDMVLVKFDRSGNELWNFTYGGPVGTDQFFRDLVIDSADNIFVVGEVQPVSALNSYIALYKFNSTGDLQWKNEEYGAGGNTFNQGRGVKIDSSGDIYVVGSTSSYGAGSHDLCLIKYNNSGNIQWDTTWGSIDEDRGTDLELDDVGNIYTSAYTFQDGYFNVGLVKFDNLGNQVWNSTWGEASISEYAYSIDLDINNEIYLGCNSFSSSIKSVILKFNITGSYQWNITSDYRLNDLYVDNQGIYAAGSISTNGFDMSLNKYDINGNLIWNYLWGGSDFESCLGITTDVNAFIYFTGVTSSFGVGEEDLSVIKFALHQETPSLINNWGSPGSNDGEFNEVFGIAIDDSGDVYITDSDNDRIQVFSSTGEYLRKWGSSGSGASEFNQPWGISINGTGYVYVTDNMNSRVQVFNSSGAYINEWGSTGSGDGQFTNPLGITIDNSTGDVLVADYNNDRVQIFSQTGQFLWEFNCTNPIDLCVSSESKIYVLTESYCVNVYNNSGYFLNSWGSYGSGDGQFTSPRSITINSKDRVFIADLLNQNVQIFSNKGHFLTKWDSNFITGLAINGSDHVYTAYTESIKVYGQKSPEVSNIVISPEKPNQFDNLIVSYDYFDENYDLEDGTEIRWYRNEILQSSYNDEYFIPSNSTSRWDEWYVTIRPNDGKSFGVLETSSHITIENILPIVENITLSPNTPLHDDNLTLNYDYFDQDGDLENNTEIRWYKDGILQSSYNDLAIIPSRETLKGEEWYATICPNDGISLGIIETSESVIINNDGSIWQPVMEGSNIINCIDANGSIRMSALINMNYSDKISLTHRFGDFSLYPYLNNTEFIELYQFEVCNTTANILSLDLNLYLSEEKYSDIDLDNIKVFYFDEIMTEWVEINATLSSDTMRFLIMDIEIHEKLIFAVGIDISTDDNLFNDIPGYNMATYIIALLSTVFILKKRKKKYSVV